MNKLLKKLILVEEINTDNYPLGWKVFDYVVENPDCIISFANRNEWVKYNPIKKDSWVTFGDMRTLRFYTKDSEVYVEVKVYKPSNSYDDYGMDLQWIGAFKLSVDFLDNIKEHIDKKFLKFCNDSYDDYLDSLREKWVNEFAEKMLAD